MRSFTFSFGKFSNFPLKGISKLKVWLRFQNTNPITLICKIEALKINIVRHPFNNICHIFSITHHTTLLYKNTCEFYVPNLLCFNGKHWKMQMKNIQLGTFKSCTCRKKDAPFFYPLILIFKNWVSKHFTIKKIWSKSKEEGPQRWCHTN